MECQVPKGVIDIPWGGEAPHRGVKPRTARLLHYVPPLRVTPRPPNEELVNGSLSRTNGSTSVVRTAIHTGSADLIWTVLLQDDVNAAEQLAGDGAHGRTPWLALLQPTLQTRSQIRI